MILDSLVLQISLIPRIKTLVRYWTGRLPTVGDGFGSVVYEPCGPPVVRRAGDPAVRVRAVRRATEGAQPELRGALRHQRTNDLLQSSYIRVCTILLLQW